MEKEYYSLKEVADLLGLSKQTMFRKVKSGDINAILLNGVYRISKNELDSFLTESKRKKGNYCLVEWEKVENNQYKCKLIKEFVDKRNAQHHKSKLEEKEEDAIYSIHRNDFISSLLSNDND